MLLLEIEIPFASFKESQSRELRDSYPIAPPSTVYGMLLSAIGEWNRHRYKNSSLALGLIQKGKKGTIIRTFQRFKNKDINHPSNSCPDYQKIMCNTLMAVAIDGELAEKVKQGLAKPDGIKRFGALSLGESRDLVNTIEVRASLTANWLVTNPNGQLTLPYWTDHIGSKNTKCLNYNWELKNSSDLNNKNWTIIKDK